ncbi:uncharacterized protein (TIGR00255 family) [Tamilnaduibacter salinus]|uniref:Uncharacterized protein (TIGR00255 family) n=1 Tax=Tamilnaduibacter salinus TaxID=1484056 RepID=A0A2U1CXK6_9GAMM|nr:YicC/YloC family endoribonuclease [Tamilnaduibacter salinus]PVY76987.1 uncharacterized protein (TIGR00255 family) [Tamilnaduibacter salinus]
MIRSMTAFARKDTEGAWGTLTCELRTVNHRYLEPSLRLPEGLRELENELRETLRTRLGRGKVDVGMRLNLQENTEEGLTVNMALAESLNHAARQVNRILDNPAHVSALEVLRWPGVLEAPAHNMAPVHEAARQLFGEALDELITVREREGERLRPLFDERLTEMSDRVAEVRSAMPRLLERQSEQIRERFQAAGVELDEDRLAQELTLLAQKSDVSEELDRLDAHVREVRETLDADRPIGRRLDFLMQELNREANTLSSKSLDADVTRHAVSLKVLIEQMREQVQNLE